MSDMKVLIRSVNRLITEEHARANKNNPPCFASDHEAFSVIWEELEESADEFAETDIYLKDFWRHIKADDNDALKLDVLEQGRKHALLSACEMIQTAAMYEKAIDSLYKRTKPKEVLALQHMFEEVLEVYD